MRRRVISTVENIKTIDAEFVRENYITVDFCKFVYQYSSLVSRTKSDFRNAMQTCGDEFNVFEIVGESDISWSLMYYASSKDYWLWNYHEKIRNKRMKQLRETLPPPLPALALPPRRRTRANAGEEEEEEEDEPQESEIPQEAAPMVPPNPRPVAKALFTNASQSGKSKYDCGLTNEGRHFYMTMKKALKEVDGSEWNDVWEQFWSEQKKVEVPSKKRKRRAAMEEDRDECFGEDFVMDELDDGEGDEWDINIG